MRESLSLGAQSTESATTLFGESEQPDSLPRAVQRRDARPGDKAVDGRERVVDGRDDERVADPDEARRRQGQVLRHRDDLGGAAQVLEAGGDEAPVRAWIGGSAKAVVCRRVWIGKGAHHLNMGAQKKTVLRAEGAREGDTRSWVSSSRITVRCQHE